MCVHKGTLRDCAGWESCCEGYEEVPADGTQEYLGTLGSRNYIGFSRTERVLFPLLSFSVEETELQVESTSAGVKGGS